MNIKKFEKLDPPQDLGTLQNIVFKSDEFSNAPRIWKFFRVTPPGEKKSGEPSLYMHYTFIIHDENNFSCILQSLYVINKPLKNTIISSNKITHKNKKNEKNKVH